MKNINKSIKIEETLLVLLLFFILTSNNCAHSLAYCGNHGQGIFCENGATPTCSNGLTPTCYFNGFSINEDATYVPACCASVSSQSCNFFILCPDPKPIPTPVSIAPQPTPPPPAPIPTQPTQPGSVVITSCDPATQLLICTFLGLPFDAAFPCKCASNTTSSTISTNFNPPQPNATSYLSCNITNDCGSGKYCNQGTKRCEVNPSNCFSGCYSESDCNNGEQCSSNCCEPIPSASNSIFVSQEGGIRRNGFNLALDFKNFDSKTLCSVTSTWQDKKLPTIPSSFFVTENAEINVEVKIPRRIQNLLIKSNNKTINSLVECRTNATPKINQAVTYPF